VHSRVYHLKSIFLCYYMMSSVIFELNITGCSDGVSFGLCILFFNKSAVQTLVLMVTLSKPCG